LTTPHRAHVADAPDINSAIAVLRKQGLRVSAARRRTIETLYGSDRPLTAEGVAERSGAGADVASVYRNLETLERAGLVRHFHLGHGPGLYAPARAEQPDYLVCESCGEFQPLEPRALDRVRTLIRREFGFSARFNHFPIAGLCARCAAREQAA
jgi:Fur family ferric uptake transcriptional regulator